jgi:hypothetical protein
MKTINVKDHTEERKENDWSKSGQREKKMITSYFPPYSKEIEMKIGLSTIVEKEKVWIERNTNSL